MQANQIAVGLLAGAVLIRLGLVPGSLQRLADRMRSFRDLFSSQFPVGRAQETEYENLPRPLWLAGLGAALIALNVLAYIWI
jgi:hypothetical protein